ncbi:MAG: D-3-phosphoglycerate dehydrogenase, partial [Myxococcales bacterium]|nr:D-3-phosphoglycerate dehydrogenase [Myxococcales bacterium]
MRLLIADKLHPRAIEELRTLPLEVVYEPELTKETLEKSLHGVGILVVRSTDVTAAAIENTKQLNLIVRAGASYGTIDVRAASKRGIYVANCPGK